MRLAGHEVVHHGYVHENPANLSCEEGEKVLQMKLKFLSKISAKLRGYRPPYWDFKPNILMILERHGFDYDSNFLKEEAIE